MPDYQKGKIYKLYSNESPDEIYIGSTTQSLCRRKQGHKDKKNCNSKILFEKYEQVIIELIEYFPCNTREELNKKEGEYIRMTDCINKEIADIRVLQPRDGECSRWFKRINIFLFSQNQF